MNKIDVLTAMIQTYEIDIITVTESWLNDKILSSEVQMLGYDLFRSDRTVCSRGGGVLLYVKQELNAVSYTPKTQFPEQIWCKITNNVGAKLLIGVCYRSDNRNLYHDGNNITLKDLVSEVSNKNMVLFGDFNYPAINWSSKIVNGSDAAEAEKFMDCIDDNFCTQHVTEPTREQNVLDLVISSNHQMVNEVQVLDRFDTSDHNMIVVELNFSKELTNATKIRLDYNRADWDKIRYELAQIDWEKETDKDVLEGWKNFKTILIDIEKRNVPVKVTSLIGRKQKPIWMTYTVSKLIKKKRCIYKKYKNNKHPAYIRIAKQVKAEVKNSKLQFEQKLADNIKEDKKSFSHMLGANHS